MRKILVCGSRTWTDRVKMAKRLDQIGEMVNLIEGGAPGADSLAREYAIRANWAYTEVPAIWRLHGKAAGPIRNRQMLDMGPELVIAFHHDYQNSKGTKDCVEEAKRRGIPVEIIS